MSYALPRFSHGFSLVKTRFGLGPRLPRASLNGSFLALFVEFLELFDLFSVNKARSTPRPPPPRSADLRSGQPRSTCTVQFERQDRFN